MRKSWVEEAVSKLESMKLLSFSKSIYHSHLVFTRCSTVEWIPSCEVSISEPSFHKNGFPTFLPSPSTDTFPLFSFLSFSFCVYILHSSDNQGRGRKNGDAQIIIVAVQLNLAMGIGTGAQGLHFALLNLGFFPS
ncbi:hypothetical protein SLA2020_140010 [Shorea laevis]